MGIVKKCFINALFEWDMIKQSGVIPFQIKKNTVRFMVINNRSDTRNIIPKGIVEEGMSPKQSAQKEAIEEAGIEGDVLSEPLGRYSYRKWGDTCEVEIFLLRITHIHKQWEEKYFRKRMWLDWDTFYKTVDNRIPRKLLKNIPNLINFERFEQKEKT